MKLSLLGVLGVGVLLSGCALTSKADIVGTRYFTPEVPQARLTAADAASRSNSAAVEVRLGRVSSGAHLRERIAYRDAAYEVGYYEDQRWTERPEIYVRRELLRTMFEGQHAFKRVVGGNAPTLEVEVIAFDEIRLQNGGAARVQLKFSLFDGRNVLLEDTVTIDRNVAGGGGHPKIEDIVAAMAQALEAASEQVSTKVATALAR